MKMDRGFHWAGKFEDNEERLNPKDSKDILTK